jgi:hypothetical protein
VAESEGKQGLPKRQFSLLVIIKILLIVMAGLIRHKPRRNGKPRQAIILIETGFNAGLVMDHGTSGSQRQCHSFSNKKADFFGLLIKNRTKFKHKTHHSNQ